jgi:ABC-type transport system involved in cytochrome c biogenesis permease subunit
MTTLISILLLGSLATLLVVGTTGVALALMSAARAPVTTGPDIGASSGSAYEVARAAISSGMVLAAGLLLTAVVARAIAIGHAPWSNLHEVSLSFAAALVLAHLALTTRLPVAGLAPIVALVAAGLVGFALSLDDRIDPLVPALQQPLLLTVHVGSAIVGYALAGVAFAAAVAEILGRATGDGVALLPPAAMARAIGHRAVLLAFPVLTLAIVLGSVWANLAWRSYWSNDPKELAAAVTWLVFGAYLHVAGRRDRWAALAPWLIVAGFAGVLFTYIGAGLFIVGEHSYGTP